MTMMTFVEKKMSFRNVILIGLDGFGSNQLDAFEPVFLSTLFRQNLKNVLPIISAPNWASIVTGETPQRHGIFSNDVDKVGEDYPSTIFADVDGHTALFSDWPLLEKMCNDVDFVEKYQSFQKAAKYFVNNRPTFMMIHNDSIDAAGHKHGYNSIACRHAAHKTDKQIQRFFNTILDVDKQTLIIVCSDHGGFRRKHNYNNVNKLAKTTRDRLTNVPLLCSNRFAKRLWSNLEIHDFILNSFE
jgi:predicted AlkP superfamily pyrophosphatase or phosphodiesterase